MAGVFFIILSCALWALDTLIRYPLVEKGIDPVVIVFLEHALVTLVCLPRLLAAIPRAGELRLADAASFLVVGGLGSALATVCFTQAFSHLNPSLVILLQKFQPVIAISLAWVILKEPIPKAFVFWGLVSLAGALLVSSPDIAKVWGLVQLDPSRLVSESAVRGYSLVAVSVVCWGAATVFGKRLGLAGFEPGAIMGGRFLVGLVVLAFLAPWGRAFLFADPTDYLRLGAIAVAAAIAMWAYYQGLKRLSAKVCAIVELFFPLMAVFANWFILGKQLSEVQLLGGALLALGALILQVKKY